MHNLMIKALQYTEKGFHVFPVHSITENRCTCGKPTCTAPGKHPRTPQGFHDGTTDTAQIKRWWADHPDSNIGIVTGKASGIWVLDIDPRHGGDDSLLELEKKYGPLPPTKIVLTGGDGMHFYFQCPSTLAVGCRTKLFEGIDVKGDGGYVVAPPSCHISGGYYEWEVSSWEHELVPAPEWLLKHLHQLTHKDLARKEALSLEQEVPEGERNDTIARLAGCLLGKGVRGEVTLLLCYSFNQTHCCPPLPHEEVRIIINSIAKKEFQKRQGGQHD